MSALFMQPHTLRANDKKGCEMQFDCVVVGSGAAAMTAAVVARTEGLKVLLVEKSSKFGGTSARSGGVAWLPGNPYMVKSGKPDDRVQALEYLKNVTGPERVRPELHEAFYDYSSEMVQYMESRTQVRFEAIGYPDYKPELGGAVSGRSIGTTAFDGRQLGPWLSTLEPPMKSMCLLGGMMVDGMDIYHLMNMTRSAKSFAHASKRFFRYIADKVTHGRGTRLTIGNALMGRLLKSAVDAGVTLWSDSPATRLIVEKGKVVGVVVSKSGDEIQIHAPAVILATGGFAHDAQLAGQYLPKPVQDQTLCVSGASGDGLRMAMQNGAKVGTASQNFLGNQVYKRFDRHGNVVEQVVYTRRDRNKPGFILVNARGQRFANEAAPYHDLTGTMVNADQDLPVYLVCDHARLRKYGLGLLRPGPALMRPLGKYLRSGHLISADSIRGLADKLGVDVSNLEEAVQENNRYAETGQDLQFGKGNSSFDRWQGDATVKPNPNLGPIETGPFYAVRVWPSNLGTFLGLSTDDKARVLNGEDKPVQGLYACGCDMHHLLEGAYAGGGSVLGPAMTFGYIAAKHIASAR